MHPARSSATPRARGGQRLVFCGWGVSARLLLWALRGSLRDCEVVVVDRAPVGHPPPLTHLSYWSKEPVPFDQVAIGAWGAVRVSGRTQAIRPYTLRLLRSADLLGMLDRALAGTPITSVHGEVRRIERDAAGYVVHSSAGALAADWVFDSCVDVEPRFPRSGRASGAVQGSGLVLTADEPAFDPAVADMFAPLADAPAFAYVLPIDLHTVLLESASFGTVPPVDAGALLLAYARERWPSATFRATHEERGVIPLGFAPGATAGERHVLLGTKRGLVKPSTGYGLMNTYRESLRLAQRWRLGAPLRPVRRPRPAYAAMDRAFLGWSRDPAKTNALIEASFSNSGAVRALELMDEALSPLQLAAFVGRNLPTLTTLVL